VCVRPRVNQVVSRCKWPYKWIAAASFTVSKYDTYVVYMCERTNFKCWPIFDEVVANLYSISAVHEYTRADRREVSCRVWLQAEAPFRCHCSWFFSLGRGRWNSCLIAEQNKSSLSASVIALQAVVPLPYTFSLSWDVSGTNAVMSGRFEELMISASTTDWQSFIGM